MNYELIIFDLDGTILDTSVGICKAASKSLIKNKISFQDVDLSNLIGPPIEQSLSSLFPVLTSNQIKDISSDFRQEYQNNHLLEAKPYEGIYSLLEYLQKQGYKTAIATNKRLSYTLPLLESFRLTQYFNYIGGSDDNNKKTKSDLILEAINANSVQDYSKVLMIGDTNNDKEAAENIGVDFLGVTYGFGFKEDRCPDYAKSVSDIKSRLQ